MALTGQLSEFQSEVETVLGGHLITDAIKNDLAEILLGLFAPWDQLPAIFQRYAADYQTRSETCAEIWKVVEPILSSHNRNFTRNIELHRK